MSHQRPKTKVRERYGLCAYKGPDFVTSKEAILALFEDDCKSSGIEQILQSQCMERIRHTLGDYIHETECNLNRVKSSRQAADLADKMKEDDKLVQLLVESIYTAIEVEDRGVLENLVYTPDCCIGYSICSGCPYYLKSQICLIGARSIGGEISQEILFNEKFNLTSSVKMVKIIFNVLHYIICNTSGEISELLKFKVLLEDLQLLMGAYKLMNPTGDEITSQEDKLIDLLTKDRQPVTQEEVSYWKEIFNEVLEDIESTRLPYVREIQKCISTIRKEMAVGYQLNDYYLSMKSTPQIRDNDRERHRKSLLNSVIERDTYKYDPRTQAFDALIGYQSHYLEDTDTVQCPIKTKLIQNPGKFKMRGIHFAENAIQDRCNFIHRCVSKGLKEMKTDCSHNQDKGRSFARTLTLQWKTAKVNDRIGIYCLDFSNATDTMDQDFQNAVLAYCMNPTVAEYWGMLSESQKTFERSDGSLEKYVQKTGQPQGLLGSFDAFSLAHHFMMLMVMKHCKFDKHFSEEFYRILGDDSILNSIEPELDLEDEDFVLSAYKRVCRIANFTINDDKGIYTRYHSDFSLASFAKVDFMNGVNFSPTPYRLATMYIGTSVQKTELGHLGVALWRGNVGYLGYQAFLHSSLSGFSSGPWIIKMLESGLIPSLSYFETGEQLTSSQAGRASYCTCLAVLDSTMQSILMDDKELSFSNPKKSRNSFSDLFRLLPESELETISMDHKIFTVLEDNNRADCFYSDLLNLDSLDDKCLRIASELMNRKIQGDVVDEAVNLYDILQTEKIIRQALDNPLTDVSEVFPEASQGLVSFLKEMKLGLMTRGLTKRPTRTAYILEESFKLYQRLSNSLGQLPEDKGILPEEGQNLVISLG